MKRAFLFAVSAALAACAHSPDMPATGLADSSQTIVVDNPGQITVAGLAPSHVLGAVDSARVAEHPTIANGSAQTAVAADTNSEGAIKVGGAQPAAVLAAIDPAKLVGKNGAKKAEQKAAAKSYIAPKVQAVTERKKGYTTKDLARAQLEAMRDDGR